MFVNFEGALKYEVLTDIKDEVEQALKNSKFDEFSELSHAISKSYLGYEDLVAVFKCYLICFRGWTESETNDVEDLESELLSIIGDDYEDLVVCYVRDLYTKDHELILNIEEAGALTEWVRILWYGSNASIEMVSDFAEAIGVSFDAERVSLLSTTVEEWVRSIGIELYDEFMHFNKIDAVRQCIDELVEAISLD